MPTETAFSLKSNLIEHGYAPINQSISSGTKQLIQKVNGEFLNLVEEDSEYLKQLCFDLSKNNDPDDGVIVRSGDKKYDRKIFTHIRPRLEMLINWRDVDVTRYKSFFKDCNLLYKYLLDLSVKTAQKLDKELSGLGYEPIEHRITTEKALQSHSLRLLWYEKPKTHAEYLASPHTDRNLFTIPLFESHPGLWLQCGDKQPVFYEYNDDEMIVFTGKKMHVFTGGEISYEKVESGADEPKYTEILTGGLISATRHWVKFPKPLDANRTSMVFFVHDETPIMEKPGPLAY